MKFMVIVIITAITIVGIITIIIITLSINVHICVKLQAT